MNETLNKALITIINGVTAATNTAIDFLSREIPLVIQELLLYKFVESLVWFLMGLTLTIVGSVFVYKMIRGFLREIGKGYNSNEMPFFAGGLFGGMAVVMCFIPVTITHMEWLQIWLAPRIYLIEYAAQLYKGMPK